MRTHAHTQTYTLQLPLHYCLAYCNCTIINQPFQTAGDNVDARTCYIKCSAQTPMKRKFSTTPVVPIHSASPWLPTTQCFVNPVMDIRGNSENHPSLSSRAGQTHPAFHTNRPLPKQQQKRHLNTYLSVVEEAESSLILVEDAVPFIPLQLIKAF